MANNTRRYLFIIGNKFIQNEVLKDYLNDRFFYEVKTFDSGEEALLQLNLNPEIIILGYHLSIHTPRTRNGIEILKVIKDQYPAIRIIMFSGQDSIDVAVEAMKYGAYDYIVKGEGAFSRIENVINDACEQYRVSTLNKGYRYTIAMLSVVIGLIILVATYFLVVRPRG